MFIKKMALLLWIVLLASCGNTDIVHKSSNDHANTWSTNQEQIGPVSFAWNSIVTNEITQSATLSLNDVHSVSGSTIVPQQ